MKKPGNTNIKNRVEYCNKIQKKKILENSQFTFLTPYNQFFPPYPFRFSRFSYFCSLVK